MGVIIGIMLGAVVGFIGIGAIVRIVLKFLGKSKQKINKR
nr:MAG TPA: Cell-membrane associated Mucin15 [Caudoviricetes sp.]